MNLLFDHNLSPRLIKLVGDLYPGSVHVRDVALHAADDQIVWVRRGNCTTDEIALLLRHHFDDLQTFARDEQAAFLAVG
jgi:predicted nuclease of predicted toxin-antitoxin system